MATCKSFATFANKYDPVITEADAEELKRGGGMARVNTRKSRGYQYLAWNGRAARWEMFGGKSWKPATDEVVALIDPEEKARRDAKKAERRAASSEKAAAAAESVSVGDIFASCWGYEQTNVEFYEVVAKSGCFVTVREVAQETEATSWGSWTCSPVPGAYLERSSFIGDNRKGKRCKVSPYGRIKITRDGVVSAGKWTGRKMHASDWY